MKIHIITQKQSVLNKYIGLFIVHCLKKLSVNLSYGNQMSMNDLKQKKITLPKLPNGSPNWEYMEQYIINLFNKTKIPQPMPIKASEIDLNCVKWKAFEIKQVFDKIYSVKGKTIDSYQVGMIPYITTSAISNGLTNYIFADTEVMTNKNVITVDPIKGKTFYHPYEFVGRGGAGSAINVLESRNLNKYVGLFIATMIESNSFPKASYGTQLNGKRLKKQKIMLPVTGKETPDWDFMEDYIKSISNSNLL